MQARTDLIRPEFLRLGPQGPEVFGVAADALRAFAVIERAEHGPPRGRREYQQDRLRSVFEHARRHSPFWSSRMPAPGRAALRDLPVLTRGALRRQVAAEGALPVPAEHGGAQENATSGSSGEVLRFFVTSLNAAYNQARYAFDDLASGRDLALPVTAMSKRFKTVETIASWPTLTGQVWRTGPGRGIPVSGLSVEEGVAAVLAAPVGHLLTRPALLLALAEAVARGGPRPEMLGEILTNSETVPPALRAQVRDVLGARIADRYSCEEVGPIAFQCPKRETHYHVATSNVVLEVVDDLGREVAEGKPGNLLVTGLQAVATPVLRYDIGDVARLLPRCACGHDGPALTDLQGRRKSLLRLPDGRRRYCNLSASTLLDAAPVREFRILQTARDRLVIRIVADRPLAAAECEAVAALLRAESSAAFAIAVEQVDAIDWGQGEKRITVMNLTEGVDEGGFGDAGTA